MAKKPSATAVSTPAPAKAEPINPNKVYEAAVNPEKVYYYRIRKITGFLYEILEVEVDETVNPPRAVSKQDLKHLLVDKMTDLVCPHPDTIAKRKRDVAREAQRTSDATKAAQIVAAEIAKVQE